MQNYPTTRCAELAPPTTEPVTLAQAKLHLRVESAFEDDDALITALIIAARQYCENLSGRTLAQRSYLQTMESFPANGIDIVLRRSPVTAIASINYYDDTGTNVLMTLETDYRTNFNLIPARIRTPVLTKLWAKTYLVDDAVRIIYTAGADSAPTAAKQTILLLVGHWYENRESVVVGATSNAVDCTVTSLIDSYRLGDIAL